MGVRILFLGNNYHPISTACLQALLDESDCTIVVGILDPRRRGVVKTTRKLLRERGVSSFVSKVADVLMAAVARRLRDLGFRASGSLTLDEIVTRSGVEYFWCANINSSRSVDLLRSLNLDLIIVANFSQIIRGDVLEIPRLGCINVHPSLLPKYRGPIPFYWVLKYCEKNSGVTIHYIDQGIDSGDIILQESFPIAEGETEASLRDRSAAIAARLLPTAIRRIATGGVKRIPQDETEATYFTFPPRGASAL
jgi:methionyl-tRNA formyltransferase